jgi:hypothetical protein
MVLLSPVALCRECGKLGPSIFGEKEFGLEGECPDAPTCVFCKSTNIVSYFNPELRANHSEKYTELTSGFYYCPQCKEFGLSFKDTGATVC